jgi:hypothetical protein
MIDALARHLLVCAPSQRRQEESVMYATVPACLAETFPVSATLYVSTKGRCRSASSASATQPCKCHKPQTGDPTPLGRRSRTGVSTRLGKHIPTRSDPACR